MKQFEEVQHISTEVISSCHVCGSERHEETASGYDYEYQTCSNKWKVVKCSDCTFSWLNPRPASDTLSTIYPKNYYSYAADMKINPIALWAKKKIDRRKIKTILKHLTNPQSSNYLDIGCGDGRYLLAAKTEGMPIQALHGLELDETQVETLRTSGLQVLCEKVEDCRSYENNSIDLITMFHVIEHVNKPRDVIRKLEAWLKPDGILAIETPNIDSIDYRLFKNGLWGGFHFPRHWTFFSPSSLIQLLEQEGLKVVDVKFKTGHSFWLFSIHHYFKYIKGWNKIAELFNPLNSLLFLSAFTFLDILRGALGQKTSAMLITAKKKS